MPVYSQLSLVLINRPRRDGTLSWRWYTAAVGGIGTRDLAVASPAPYHSATAGTILPRVKRTRISTTTAVKIRQSLAEQNSDTSGLRVVLLRQIVFLYS